MQGMPVGAPALAPTGLGLQMLWDNQKPEQEVLPGNSHAPKSIPIRNAHKPWGRCNLSVQTSRLFSWLLDKSERKLPRRVFLPQKAFRGSPLRCCLEGQNSTLHSRFSHYLLPALFQAANDSLFPGRTHHSAWRAEQQSQEKESHSSSCWTSRAKQGTQPRQAERESTPGQTDLLRTTLESYVPIYPLLGTRKKQGVMQEGSMPGLLVISGAETIAFLYWSNKMS